MDCTNCELKIKNINTKNCFECKASEFIDAAKISRNNKLYNAALGRYYYAIFIRLSYLKNTYKKRNVSEYLKATLSINTSKLGSHEETITILGVAFVNSQKISNSDKGLIQSLFRDINSCREKRHVADYYFDEIVKEKDVQHAEKTVSKFEKLYSILKGVV